MNVKALGFLLTVVLLLSPETVEAQYGRRRGYYGYQRRGRGRGVGRAIVRGAAVIGGLYLLGAFFGRRKRSVDDVYEEEEADPYEDALDAFDLAMQLDDDMCLQKALCDIMATSNTQKKPSAVLKILRMIYSGDMPLLDVEGHDDATKLLKAGLLGKAAGSEEVCKIAFKKCKKSPETLKKELEQAFQEQYGTKQ